MSDTGIGSLRHWRLSECPPTSLPTRTQGSESVCCLGEAGSEQESKERHLRQPCCSLLLRKRRKILTDLCPTVLHIGFITKLFGILLCENIGIQTILFCNA